MLRKLQLAYESFYSFVIAVNLVNVFLLVTHIILLFLTMLQSGSFKDFLACYQSQKSAASDNKLMLKIEQRIRYLHIYMKKERTTVGTFHLNIHLCI